MKRIVSVFLPQWPIERLQRFAPERVPADRPFALVLSGRRGLALHAVNGRAFALGLKPGDRLADARARVPDLLSLPAEPAADRVALARLALWCGRYGAAVNIERVVAPEEKAACEHPCGLWIDSTGVAHLYGGEPALLAHLGHRLASLGLSARLGLASSHAAALALARFSPARFSSARFSSARFSSDSAPWAASALPDGAPAALASLPVEGLALAPASTLLLRRLGLKRIGDLYAIPRASLERRFPSRAAAAAVLARLDLALGDAPEALAPMRPIETFSARRAFAEPLISQAGLSAAVAALADELCQGLEAKGRGVRRLLLSAYRTDASVLEVRAGTSAPVRARAHLLRLLEGRLAGLDAGFGIDALVLAAPRTEPLAAVQQGLRSACAGARCSPALLIDRLANRLGVDNVCGLAAAQSHIPERAGRLVPALAGQAATPRPLSHFATL